MNLTSHQDLYLSSPWLNASGMLGYAPPAAWNWEQPPGAFVTNPVSLSSRPPALNRALIPFPGGFLLHNGHPNPGIQAVIRRHRPRWARASIPIWVSLLGNTPEEIQRMVKLLEDVEGVLGIVLLAPPLEELPLLTEFLQAAAGELPVILSLPLSQVESSLLQQIQTAGASALCLAAPRGCLPDASGKLTYGRLYGPALFPQCLSALRTCRTVGLPVIAGSGVTTAAQGETLLAAGALAVQLDFVLWL